MLNLTTFGRHCRRCGAVLAGAALHVCILHQALHPQQGYDHATATPPDVWRIHPDEPVEHDVGLPFAYSAPAGATVSSWAPSAARPTIFSTVIAGTPYIVMVPPKITWPPKT